SFSNDLIMERSRLATSITSHVQSIAKRSTYAISNASAKNILSQSFVALILTAAMGASGAERSMRRIASALIALSVLAGVALSVSAQRREDDASRDFWKWQNIGILASAGVPPALPGRQ